MYEFVPLFIFLAILLYISIEDIKYRMIPYWTVPVLFGIAPIYIYLAGFDFTKASFSFMMIACLFVFLFIVGRGSFGIGDVMVMAVIGWTLADISHAYTYLIYMFAPTLIAWFIISYAIHIKRFGAKGFFKFRRKIKTSELKPGMVLESDNFMHGLTPDKIEELQRRHDEIEIKQPLSFIPVAFISAILFFSWIYFQPFVI